MIVDHDFAVPWRETKFERAVDFVGTLKGLFLHVEMILSNRGAARPDTAAITTPSRRARASPPRSTIGWRCSISSPASAPGTGSFRHSTLP